MAFAAANRLLNPRDVAYTIFPHGLYERARSAAGVFSRYERFHERIRRRPHYRWGTYFRRMTHYETTGGPVNQLDRIISAVNSRGKTHRAAYTILIQYPCVDTTRPLGAPCLNFIAVQMEGRDPRRLGLLCVYRNHDFANRAYGNYWGLCDLLVFLARETQSQPGPLTCLSSHAYLGMSVARALQLLGRMP